MKSVTVSYDDTSSMLSKNFLKTGTSYHSFEDARALFEDATVVSCFNTKETPIEVLSFDGFRDGHIHLRAAPDKSYLISVDKLPIEFQNRFSKGEWRYLVKADEVILFLSQNCVSQMARKIGMKAKEIKAVSHEAAFKMQTILNETGKLHFVIRQEDGYCMGVNMFHSDKRFRSAFPEIAAGKKERLCMREWEMNADYTRVLLVPENTKGIKNVLPCIRNIYSDSGMQERISFGLVAKQCSEPVILQDIKINPAEIVDIGKEFQKFLNVLNRFRYPDRMFDTSSLKENETVAKSLGRQRVRNLQSEKKMNAEEYLDFLLSIPDSVFPIDPANDVKVMQGLGEMVSKLYL